MPGLMVQCLAVWLSWSPCLKALLKRASDDTQNITTYIETCSAPHISIRTENKYKLVDAA
jgi:hypothetical protein